LVILTKSDLLIIDLRDCFQYITQRPKINRLLELMMIFTHFQSYNHTWVTNLIKNCRLVEFLSEVELKCFSNTTSLFDGVLKSHLFLTLHHHLLILLINQVFCLDFMIIFFRNLASDRLELCKEYFNDLTMSCFLSFDDMHQQFMAEWKYLTQEIH